MKKNIQLLYLTTILSFNLLTTIHSYSANEVKIQRVLDTGKVNECITQDKDGLLWFGTEGEGLFCYDGNEFKKIKIMNSKNRSPIIWSIFVDRENTIWFLVQNEGLYSYDKSTGICKKHKPAPNSPNFLTSDNVNWIPNNITEDKDGLIWFGTTDGLNSFDKKTGKFTQYKHNPNNPNSLSNNSVWIVFVDKDGLIWIGTQNGLNCYNKKTNKFLCYKHKPNNSDSIIDKCIRAIAEDKEGNLWIGTRNAGIDKFDKKTKTFINYRNNPNDSNSISYNEIHHIMVDQFNNLWICYEGSVGVDRYNIKTNTFKHYSYDPKNPNSISSNDIVYSFEDSTGIIWLINSSGSIDKCVWKQDVFKKYSHNPQDPSSISSNNIIKLYEDKSGNIWVGTFSGGGGLSLYAKNGTFKNFKPMTDDSSSSSNGSVSSILDAPDGNLWLGIRDNINGSVKLFNIASKKVIKSFKNPYSNCAPSFLTRDNKDPNVIWFASFFEGNLYKLNTMSGSFTQYKHVPGDINSVSNENTFSILQDGDILWLATGGNGLAKFNKTTEKCIYYTHDPNDKSSISGNIVLESYIDHKGNFWVTTEDGGLNKFDRETENFTSYGTESGFPSSGGTRHILEDKQGCLWISTNFGIAKFDPNTLKVIRLFTKADGGLPSNQFDRLANTLKDSKGDFWFSTMKGICRFDPNDANNIEQNLHIPPVILTSFKSKEGTYNEQGVKQLTNVILPWPDNSFEFTFTVLDYMDPGKNQYAYRLEGFDKDWNYTETNHFGQYIKLPHGKYILHLKGANCDRLWNEQSTSIKITIEPAFWQTWWFKLAIAVIFLVIVLLIVQHRRKIQEKRAISMRDHAIAETTSLVAHDVRKPFSQLKIMLQMLPKLTLAQTKDYSEDLDISIRKVDAMLMDIIEASREMKYELVSGNILTVLDLAIKDVSRYHPNKYINFYYSFDAVALVALDEQRMCRALENIIDNAFDFLPNKEGIMWFSIKEKNNKVKIIIGNSHSHISKDQMNKIFQDKFTSGKKGGTGLGLSIATKIIKGHNGSITVKNVRRTPGFVPENVRNIQGVEFMIVLPITGELGYTLKDPLLENSEEAKAALGMVKKESPLAGSSEIDTLIKKLESLKQKPNLLILDDESIYRMRIRDVLGNLGDLSNLIHVYDAGSYKEATDVLNHTKIDYLICDIDLSDKINDGFSVLSKTLEKYPSSMVLIHTNRKKPEDINKAKTLGACGYCTKPITEAILVDLLLNKELWPSDFRKRQSEQPRKRITTYIKAVPHSTILIVNDDPLALKLTLTMLESYINPKDNVSIFAVKSYVEARDIIESKKLDVVISDFNLDSPETGVDVCRYIREKQPESICIIYSGISGGKIEELKEANKNCIDDVFSNSYEIKDMLSKTFKILRDKKTVSTVLTESEILSELIYYTISMLYRKLDKITSHVEKAPKLLSDLENFKAELDPIIKDMDYIENIHNAVIDYIENGRRIDPHTANELTTINQLLKKYANNKTKGKLLDEYLKILHFLRHDITGNIIIVKNFILEVEMFAESMGDEVKLFAEENVIKLQGLNEAITTVEKMLKDGALKPKTENIRLIVRDIIKKSMNKILSIR